MLPSHGLRRTRPADLPSWEELNVGRSRVEKRRLSPDAIVELRAERTRVFVDDEMGFGSLPRSAENARAWAFARLTRYASFMVRGGNRTLYAQKYPDRWKAKLVLLAHSEERASTLTEVITEWQKVTAPYRSSRGRSRCGRLQVCLPGISCRPGGRSPVLDKSQPGSCSPHFRRVHERLI